MDIMDTMDTTDTMDTMEPMDITDTMDTMDTIETMETLGGRGEVLPSPSLLLSLPPLLDPESSGWGQGPNPKVHFLKIDSQKGDPLG